MVLSNNKQLVKFVFFSLQCAGIANSEGVDNNLVAQCIQVCTEKETGNESPPSDGKKMSVQAFTTSLGVEIPSEEEGQVRIWTFRKI